VPGTFLEQPSPTKVSGAFSAERTSVDDHSDLSLLFHRLNNQLGILLANAELVEAKAADDVSRRRAGQMVASALDALATAKELRQRIKPR
jgi:hypothetical protein